MMYKSRNEKGASRPMVFEDFFGSMLGDRHEDGRSRSPEVVRISRQEYESLKVKAEQYESLVEEHKKVKDWNDRMLKELDDMKLDARKFRELEEEKEKFLKKLLEVRADFDNYRKRQERNNANYKVRATENILKKLTMHYDDLERASNQLKMMEGAEGISKGFEIIVDNFKKLLDAEGVRSMDSEGQKFDPYKHEALSVEEGRDDLPENTIVEVLDKGYYLNNKVLKVAKVRISKPSKEISKLQTLTKKIEIN